MGLAAGSAPIMSIFEVDEHLFARGVNALILNDRGSSEPGM
jgi:hypothetical protein